MILRFIFTIVSYILEGALKAVEALHKWLIKVTENFCAKMREMYG